MSKYIRFSHNRNAWSTLPDGSPLARYGIIEGDRVFETGSLWSTEKKGEFPLADLRLLPPCWPSKIVCVGRNYVDHAKELGNPVPAEPLLFYKPVSSLIAGGDHIVYPPISQMVSFEGELGLVIGRQARHVAAESAMGYVFGYTIVNDVTARTLQQKHRQWLLGKGIDTFCPMGPAILTADEVPDVRKLNLRTWVNGELRQDAVVADLIFDIPTLIETISAVIALEPGDVIATGTPVGVGIGFTPPKFLKAGDRVAIEISGIGRLENPVG